MMFSRFARRHLWVFLVALAAVAAMLNAKAISALAASRLAPSADALAGSGARHLPGSGNGSGNAAPVPARTVAADVILERNPFEHGTSLVTAAEPGPLDPGAGPGPDMPTPACTGVRVHVITASTDPGWSFAAMSSSTTPRPTLYRRGGLIDGNAVRFVGWDRVWLDQGGHLCQAELFGAGAPVATPAPQKQTLATPTTPQEGTAPPGLPPAIARGIVKVSDTEFNIDRGTLNAILENQQLFMQATRIQPENIGGRVAGIRLFGVKPGTLLGTLGLQNGDRIDSINGVDIGSPVDALQAYARLREAERLDVKVERGGRQTGVTYNVR